MDKLIKARFTKNGNGEPYGREYTYLTKDEVQYGQTVYADTKNGEAELKVTDVNIPKSEVPEDVLPKLKYIHTEKKNVTEKQEPLTGEVVETEFSFVENECSLPVIKINFEELKAELTKKLAEYKSLVVTEITLPESRKAQKELADLSKKIDRYRIDKKAELSAPIVSFEKQCKELVSLIQEAEAPLKKAIKEFDDKEKNARRAKKREKAEEIIADIVLETGLNAKYAAKLTIIDKYLNLSGTEKDVRDDVEARAFAFKVEQDREAERLEIIQGLIDEENKNINSKLTIDDFKYFVDSEVSITVILSQIKERAKKIYDAEHPATKPEPKPEPQTEAPKAEVVQNEPKQEVKQEPSQPEPAANEDQEPFQQETQKWKVVIEVRETAERIGELGSFLKSHGYNYEVKEQVEL